jgi:2Fe-2S ferredoxin
LTGIPALSEITLQVIDLEGAERKVTAAAGDVLMHVLRDNISVDIGICGGEISCGTCLVRLEPAWSREVPAAGDDEIDLLDVLGAGDDARLGCQVVLDGRAHRMRVTLLHED